jgi:plasmid stability protein
MKSLHIRNLDDDIVLGLKVRAERHHRSVQKEVEVLLRDAARMMNRSDEQTKSPLQDLHIVKTGHEDSMWSRDTIYGVDGR